MIICHPNLKSILRNFDDVLYLYKGFYSNDEKILLIDDVNDFTESYGPLETDIVNIKGILKECSLYTEFFTKPAECLSSNLKHILYYQSRFRCSFLVLKVDSNNYFTILKVKGGVHYTFFPSALNSRIASSRYSLLSSMFKILDKQDICSVEYFKNHVENVPSFFHPVTLWGGIMYNRSHSMESLDGVSSGELSRLDNDKISVYGTQNDKNLLTDVLCEKIKGSCNYIEKFIEERSRENIVICFNGGKDCLVVLDLIKTNLKKNFGDKKLKVFMVHHDDMFDEVEKFIIFTLRRYNIEEIYEYDGSKGMKNALIELKSQFPDLTGCILGTRKSDPFGSRTDIFSKTDSDWPQFDILNPILDWSYSEVWNYIKYYNIPYCKLYDLGYSSLGKKSLTVKNKELVIDEEMKLYLKACELSDERFERSSRQ